MELVLESDSGKLLRIPGTDNLRTRAINYFFFTYRNNSVRCPVMRVVFVVANFYEKNGRCNEVQNESSSMIDKFLWNKQIMKF